MNVRIATRGSELALWQARWVEEQFVARHADCTTEIVVVRTTGDIRTDRPLRELAGRGVFVTEVEEAVRSGAADIAVHSAKDLPSSDPEGLVIAAYCQRADPRDVLIGAPGVGILDLDPGTRIGTGSARRVALLRHVRPDLDYVPVRGNVDTRIAKVDSGEVDAVVLAAAGVHRLRREDRITQWLDPEICLPQVGQACVAVQCRSDDTELMRRVHDACDHYDTRREVSCERRFLALLGGGCTAPVAAHAISSDRFLYLFALVASEDGGTVFRTRASGHLTAIEAVARGAYDDLMEQGGAVLTGFGVNR
ncbi:MAG: hydroxymethylbilane synthase [Armatimonadota bacterium]